MEWLELLSKWTKWDFVFTQRWLRRRRLKRGSGSLLRQVDNLILRSVENIVWDSVFYMIPYKYYTSNKVL